MPHLGLNEHGHFIDPRRGIFELHELEQWTADRRYYLDANGKATADPERGETLLVAEGCQILRSEAIRLGLVRAPKATKAIAGPAETKGEGNHGG